MAKGQTNSVETPAEENSAKNKVAKFFYVAADGTEAKHVMPGVVGVVTEFADGWKDRTLFQDLSEEIIGQAAALGIANKLRDSFAGSAGDIGKAIDQYDTVKSNLKNGVWAVKGEGKGPNISILAQAVESVLVAAGRDVDDAKRKEIATALKDETQREKIKADPKVDAAYKRIYAENAVKRANEAADKAGNAESSVADLF